MAFFFFSFIATMNNDSQGLEYRSTIAGSFKNNSKNKKQKNYEIMKTEKRK